MIALLPRVFIDEVRPDEAGILAEIHGSAFARTWSAHDFASLLSDRAVFALAVRRETVFGGRKLLGFVLFRIAADEAEILTIAVRAESRGKGYGRLLMEEALRRLYRSAVANCFLEVAGDNVAAITLYRSLGFADAGGRKGYYAEAGGRAKSALVMRLQLRQEKGNRASDRAKR